MINSYYIRLDTPPKGINHATSFEGKTAAKNWEKLTAAAKELGIKPLQDFVNTKAVIEGSIDGSKKAGANSRKEGWYTAHDGLNTIRKLISLISHRRNAFEGTRTLIRDLQSYENILSAAQARGSRFHFSMLVKEEATESA